MVCPQFNFKREILIGVLFGENLWKFFTLKMLGILFVYSYKLRDYKDIIYDFKLGQSVYSLVTKILIEASFVEIIFGKNVK